MNRKRLIVGVAIFVIVAFITLCGLGVQWWRKNRQPQAHQRLPISDLVYCNSQNLKPCIVSFGLDADGKMLVNLLIPASPYPDFYLTITNTSATNKYKCQPVKDFPTNIYCTGSEMYPGETLQFTLFSTADNSVLAEGKFAIIGLLLSTPVGEITTTLPTTEVAGTIETPTPLLLEILTPIPTQPISISPTPTELTPSYPNPSYP